MTRRQQPPDSAPGYNPARSGGRRSFQVDTSAVALPEATLTSGEPIRVTVPAPPALTEEELIRRFDKLAREHGQVRERETGEEVAPGDDVQLDIIGYAHDKLIPFSIRTGLWMELAPQDTLPGFAEALAGSEVGDCVGIELVLPPTYPVASLRGVTARFMVDLVAAREVTPAEPDSEDFLRQLGRGSTLPEVMNVLGQELIEERTGEQWLEAEKRVLDVLASRLEVTLPKALIDEEIRRRWLASEGETVEEKNFSPAEKLEAFEAWRTDPATRAEVTRRLRVSLALKAVTERELPPLEPGEVYGILDKYLEAYGLTAAQVREALVTPETAAPLHNLAWHLRAVEHVMGQAELHFEGGMA